MSFRNNFNVLTFLLIGSVFETIGKALQYCQNNLQLDWSVKIHQEFELHGICTVFSESVLKY